MVNRFEVHSHSEFSNIRLLDCINKIPALIDRAIEIGLSGIALTDHECLSGAPQANFYAQEILKEHPDFKVALGNEIYLTPNRDMGQKYSCKYLRSLHKLFGASYTIKTIVSALNLFKQY